MSENPLPLLLEPEQLLELLDQDEILIIDLSKHSTHQQLHVPKARFLDYNGIVTTQSPAAGLLPSVEHLREALESAGISNDRHVVAYDDEGGGKAARLLWTLEYLGYEHFSLLNGGLHAWANERFPVTDEPAPLARGDLTITVNPAPVADAGYILEHLADPSTVLLDARSEEEFSGRRRFSRRGGHIPGAKNFDWINGMDQNRNLRMQNAEKLNLTLENLGITPDKEVICYCQTHHRSSFSYIMLKILGYPKIKGYPGSWSDWGNRDDTPIEA